MGSNPTTWTSVFIDSSVLIAASISKSGYARELIIAGFEQRVQLTLSEFVVNETRRNLTRKSPDVIPFLEWFVEVGGFQIVVPPASLVEDVARLIVAKDADIVAGAIASQSPFIASYDRRHLLSEAALIEQKWGVIVETPQELFQRLGADLRG